MHSLARFILHFSCYRELFLYPCLSVLFFSYAEWWCVISGTKVYRRSQLFQFNLYAIEPGRITCAYSVEREEVRCLSCVYLLTYRSFSTEVHGVGVRDMWWDSRVWGESRVVSGVCCFAYNGVCWLSFEAIVWDDERRGGGGFSWRRNVGLALVCCLQQCLSNHWAKKLQSETIRDQVVRDLVGEEMSGWPWCFACYGILTVGAIGKTLNPIHRRQLLRGRSISRRTRNHLCETHSDFYQGTGNGIDACAFVLPLILRFSSRHFELLLLFYVICRPCWISSPCSLAGLWCPVITLLFSSIL